MHFICPCLTGNAHTNVLYHQILFSCKNTLPTFVSASRARADCEKFNLVSWKFNLTFKMKSCRFDMNRCRWLTARCVCGRDSALCAYCNQMTNCISEFVACNFDVHSLICVKLVERFMYSPIEFSFMRTYM